MVVKQEFWRSSPSTRGGIRFATSVTAHEYMHVIQFQLQGKRRVSISDPPSWIAEGAAEWAEDVMIHAAGGLSWERLERDARNVARPASDVARHRTLDGSCNTLLVEQRLMRWSTKRQTTPCSNTIGLSPRGVSVRVRGGNRGPPGRKHLPRCSISQSTISMRSSSHGAVASVAQRRRRMRTRIHHPSCRAGSSWTRRWAVKARG